MQQNGLKELEDTVQHAISLSLDMVMSLKKAAGHSCPSTNPALDAAIVALDALFKVVVTLFKQERSE